MVQWTISSDERLERKRKAGLLLLSAKSLLPPPLFHGLRFLGRRGVDFVRRAAQRPGGRRWRVGGRAVLAGRGVDFVRLAEAIGGKGRLLRLAVRFAAGGLVMRPLAALAPTAPATAAAAATAAFAACLRLSVLRAFSALFRGFAAVFALGGLGVLFFAARLFLAARLAIAAAASTAATAAAPPATAVAITIAARTAF